MPDTEVRELAKHRWELHRCPVIVHADSDFDMEECGGAMIVEVTKSVVGDDYGSWTTYTVGLPCGHTFAEISSSLRYADDT